MSNKRKHVGPVSVYLTREQVNALIYLLNCFPAADSKAEAVQKIEHTIENSNLSDPEVAARLNIALQTAQKELKEASDWVTTAEQILGGSYLQCVSDIERRRKESKYLPNGIRTADGEPLPDAPASHRRR